MNLNYLEQCLTVTVLMISSLFPVPYEILGNCVCSSNIKKFIMQTLCRGLTPLCPSVLQAPTPHLSGEAGPSLWLLPALRGQQRVLVRAVQCRE